MPHIAQNLTAFTRENKFLMLALDHRQSFLKIIGDLDPIKTKSEIIESLQDQFSGVLIDSQYGLSAYKSKTKPYLLPVEKSGYKDEGEERLTEIECTVEEIKKLGASGAKVLFYFNVNAETANKQLETAKKVLDDCRNNHFPLFLEIVTYGTGEGKVVESVEMFLKNNIRPDVFKLEYPGSSENSKKITEILENTPWIQLTRGADFDMFRGQLRDSIINGSSGFLAGRAVWQEIGKYPDEHLRHEFLTHVVRKRFNQISEIALGLI